MALTAAGAQEDRVREVRVEVRFVDRETGREAEVGVTGQLLLTASAGTGVSSALLNLKGRKVSKTRLSAQSVVVASGRGAKIEVGREIPYQSWLLAYGQNRAYLKADVEWKEVRSRLAVRPTVIGGDYIRVRLTPEFAYQLGKKRRSVVFSDLHTEVTIPNGGETRLGSIDEHEDFYSRFLVGYDSLRRVRRVDVMLQASVLEAASGRIP
jgi:hypothetical protein